MAILEALIVLTFKSHGRAATHEQVVLVSLKFATYNKSVQLRDFGECDVKHLQQ